MAGRLKRRLKALAIRSPPVDRLATLAWRDRVGILTGIVDRLEPTLAESLRSMRQSYEDRLPMLQAQPQAARELAELDFQRAWASLLLGSIKKLRGKPYPMSPETLTKPSAVADVMRLMHWLLDEVEQRGTSRPPVPAGTAAVVATRSRAQTKKTKEQQGPMSAGAGKEQRPKSRPGSGSASRLERIMSTRAPSARRGSAKGRTSSPRVPGEAASAASTPPSSPPSSPGRTGRGSMAWLPPRSQSPARTAAAGGTARQQAVDSDLLLQRVELYKQQNHTLQREVVRLLRHVQSREDDLQTLDNMLEDMEALLTRDDAGVSAREREGQDEPTSSRRSASRASSANRARCASSSSRSTSVYDAGTAEHAAVLTRKVRAMKRVVREMRERDIATPPTMPWSGTARSHSKRGPVKLREKRLRVGSQEERPIEEQPPSIIQICAGRLEHLNLQHIARLEEHVVRAHVAVVRAAAEMSQHQAVLTPLQRQQNTAAGGGGDDNDDESGGGGGGCDDPIASCLQQLEETSHALASAAVLVPAAPVPDLSSIRPPHTTLARALAAADRLCHHCPDTIPGGGHGAGVVPSLLEHLRHCGVARSSDETARRADGKASGRAGGTRNNSSSSGGGGGVNAALDRIEVPSRYFQFPTREEWHRQIATISSQEYEQLVETMLWHANYQQLCDHIALAELKLSNAILSSALQSQEVAINDATASMAHVVSDTVRTLRKEVALPLKDLLEQASSDDSLLQVRAALQDVIDRILLPFGQDDMGTGAHAEAVARLNQRVDATKQHMHTAVSKAHHLQLARSLLHQRLQW